MAPKKTRRGRHVSYTVLNWPVSMPTMVRQHAAFLNWLRAVPNGHTRFCSFDNTCEHGICDPTWVPSSITGQEVGITVVPYGGLVVVEKMWTLTMSRAGVWWTVLNLLKTKFLGQTLL